MVVYRQKKVLLVQRPTVGRWANMWEFPHTAINSDENAVAAGKRLLADSTSIQAVPETEILTLCHGITRYRITMVCLLARYRSGQFSPSVYQQGKWVGLEELAKYPVSAPQRRLARFLTEKHAI